MGLASALSTALTGLNASETTIDVVGNNVANSNTVGFKASSALFTTQFLQTQSLGSAPGDNSGGTNPRQTGLGTKVAEIKPTFTQGTIQISSSPSDLAIQGDGFFVVQGGQGEHLYTRDGEFKTNSQNQLVTVNGQRLLGQGVDSNFKIENSTLQPITIPLGTAAVAQATQNVFFQGSLSPTGTVATTPEVIESAVLSDGSKEVPPNLSAADIVGLTPPAVASTGAAAAAGGSVAAGTYQYKVAYRTANGQDGPPSAAIGPLTTAATGSVQLSSLPAIPSGFASIDVYRTDNSGTGAYKLVGNTATTSFNDTKSDAQRTTALNESTLAQGNYSYYVTYFNSTNGLESRPTALIGPQSITVDGRCIELKNLPSPATSDFNSVRIYRNLTSNDATFYRLATLPAGTASYIDSASDASINNAANQVNLDGPPISAGLKLTDLVSRDGATYNHPFAVGTLDFTGEKGGRALDTKSLNITAETTVADLMNFVKQATGIQDAGADPAHPITGSPGATIDTALSKIKFTSNDGTGNAVDINLSSFKLKTSAGASSVNLGFNTTQKANGDSAVTDFVAYDSLGIQLNVRLTTVLESRNSTNTTFRWFADSGSNDPATGVGISAGTGEIVFDGSGNVTSVTNSIVGIDRSHVSSVSPLQFKLDFSGISGLATDKSTIAASRQDGSASGTLSSFIIGEDGLIRGVFSNGVSRDLGQVRLARFANNAGLEQRGQNTFAAGVNSGLPIEGNPGQQGIGNLVAGATELSNTDIGQNLIELITASTQYRGGARVITTVQQLFDELLNLHR